MFKRMIVTASMLLTTISITAHASNVGFLENTAMRSFNDKDWSLQNAATNKALDTYPNGKKLTWKNPANNHDGYVQPLNTTDKNGTKCRQLKMVSTDGVYTDKYQFNMCKTKGVWKADTNGS